MLPGHLWQQIKTQILQRRVPHTVMSWRFLLPNQSRAIQLHCKVFLSAWPRLPRWQWALIAIYSAMTWWLFFSWRLIYLCLKHRNHALSEKPAIPVVKHFFDLLSLSLLYGIPPYYYYRYRLDQSPRKQWLDYVYDHELPHWHQVLSGGMSRKTQTLMTEKNAFAEYMAEHGIASVKTCAFFGKGEKVGADTLFQEQSFYFKPDIGSRAEGNLVLAFDAETEAYQLLAKESIESQDGILAELNQRVQQRDYLMQPLLSNHQLITEMCGTTSLITLRLVTGLIHGETIALFAKLEVRCSDETKGSWQLALDLVTGQLSDRSDLQHEEFQKLKQRVDGKTLPFWQEAVAICLKAHAHFPDLPAIGWDVVFTDSGVKLLEGNINWGIAGHQILSDRPLLHTRLAEVYL